LLIILIPEFVKIDQLCHMATKDAVSTVLNELLKDVIPAEEAVEWRARHATMSTNSSETRSQWWRLLLLQLFVDFGTVRQVRRLLDKWRYSEVVNLTWCHGDTVLIEATIRGRDQMVNLLIEFGANLNQANSKGWTALHCAALGNCLTVAELLLQHGANVDLRTYEEHAVTPLDLAKTSKHKEIAKLLGRRSPEQEGKISGGNWGVKFKQIGQAMQKISVGSMRGKKVGFTTKGTKFRYQHVEMLSGSFEKCSSLDGSVHKLGNVSKGFK